VLAERGRQRFVQVRERVVAQVEEFEVGVAAARGNLQHPVGDLLAVAVGAGAAQDDPDSAHGALLLASMIAASSKFILADASSNKYCVFHGESWPGTRGGPLERRRGGVPARVVAGGT